MSYVAAGGHRARGHVDFSCTHSRPGAGQRRWPSSLVASLSMVAELLEGRIDTAAANGVR
jgi:hypothetical protein